MLNNNYFGWPAKKKAVSKSRKGSSETSVEMASSPYKRSAKKKPIFIYIDGQCNKNQTASAIGVYYGHRHRLNFGQRLPGLVHSTKRAEIVAATEALKRLYNSPDYKNERVYIFTDKMKLIDCLKNIFCAADLRPEVEQLRRLSCKFSSEVTFEHIYPQRKMHGCLKANKLARLALTGGPVSKYRGPMNKEINHPFDTLGAPGAIFSNKQLVDGRFPDSAPSSPWTTDFSETSSVSSLMEYVQPVSERLTELAESVKKRVKPATDMAWELAETAKKSVRDIAEVATQRVQEVNNNQVQPLINSAKQSVREVRRKRIVPLFQIFDSNHKQVGFK